MTSCMFPVVVLGQAEYLQLLIKEQSVILLMLIRSSTFHIDTKQNITAEKQQYYMIYSITVYLHDPPGTFQFSFCEKPNLCYLSDRSLRLFVQSNVLRTILPTLLLATARGNSTSDIYCTSHGTVWYFCVHRRVLQVSFPTNSVRTTLAPLLVLSFWSKINGTPFVSGNYVPQCISLYSFVPTASVASSRHLINIPGLRSNGTQMQTEIVQVVRLRTRPSRGSIAPSTRRALTGKNCGQKSRKNSLNSSENRVEPSLQYASK